MSLIKLVRYGAIFFLVGSGGLYWLAEVKATPPLYGTNQHLADVKHYCTYRVFKDKTRTAHQVKTCELFYLLHLVKD